MTHVATDVRLDAVLNALADRVRELRRERDLSVVALLFEAGISESRVRAIESGRSTASLATLVALAETFEIELSELFGETARGGFDRDESSRPDVSHEVTWGGELPPAPWMSASSEVPAPSPYVVPSEVVWGDELPAASWTTARAGADMPETIGLAQPSAPEPAPIPSTQKIGGGPLPPAPWVAEADVTVVHASDTDQAPAPSAAASGVHDSASRQGGKGSPRYVLVAPSAAAAPREPRTFSDLREGILAGRDFDSLREFAVAAAAEAGHSVVTVARIFRLPVWKLERWVAEAGYVGRR